MGEQHVHSAALSRTIKHWCTGRLVLKRVWQKAATCVGQSQLDCMTLLVRACCQDAAAAPNARLSLSFAGCLALCELCSSAAAVARRCVFPVQQLSISAAHAGNTMGQNGRAFGQRISSHDRHNEWKLFVGQVPLEVNLPHAFRLIEVKEIHSSWC